MKRKILILTTVMLFSMTSIAFADTLPKFELPELEPLEMPTLSDNFDDMLEKLKDKYNQKLETPELPQIENKLPSTDSRERFREIFGTLWSKPSLGSMPDSDFFSSYVGQMKSGSKMREDLKENGLRGIKNFLEASPQTKLHDLNAFQMSYQPKTEEELKVWLGGVGKSELKLPEVPDAEEWIKKANPAWSLLDQALKDAPMPSMMNPITETPAEEEPPKQETKKGNSLEWLLGGDGLLSKWLKKK